MKEIFILLAVMVFYSGNVCLAQYEDTGKRGVYFSKKSYSGERIPDFAADKDKLPAPILEDNPEYLQLYWKAWELAFTHFKKPPKGSPFVSDYIDEAFSPSIFQWDTIFMIMFARYAHFIFPSIKSLDNFYCRQYENGYICREIQEADGADFVFVDREHTINPPLFSWCEVENFKITGDKSRYASVLPVIEKYTEWLEKYRRKENTAHNLYWQTGLGSGMDNTPRSGSGWTDMSCQMVMLYNDMAVMSDDLGLTEKAKQFREKSKDISDRINKMMWNDTDGLYYDLDDQGNQIKWKTAGCFWPLLAGIASDEQAQKLIMHLKDPKSFWRTIPFPSLAADQEGYKPDGQYWLGGVWAPTNVMIIKGLEKYKNPEFYEFASMAVQKYLDGMYQVYKKTGTIWENYSPEAYSRGLPAKPDFVGWSGCGPIELLIENVLGFMPDGADRKLTWRLNRIDKHGINKLRFGDVMVDLVCERRKDINSPAKLTVNSNKAFDLVVVKFGTEAKEYKVKEGRNEIEVQ